MNTVARRDAGMPRFLSLRLCRVLTLSFRIVEFHTREEALRAITQLNDTRIGNSDRPIFVREDREDRNAPGGPASRVRNLLKAFFFCFSLHM
jgi:hypothetical protein